MIEITSDKIITPELIYGAIFNLEFQGFKEDYSVLHCLLRKYQPKTFLEIGCNMGVGTKIIKNAIPDSDVFSLDLPTELAHISLQSPVSEGKGDSVGHLCNLPFTLLRADSMEFDYSKYPCEGYYIDGEHSTKNVEHEVSEVLKLNPKLIVLHDTDMPEVMQGIVNGWNSSDTNDYELYRVIDTRVSYFLNTTI